MRRGERNTLFDAFKEIDDSVENLKKANDRLRSAFTGREVLGTNVAIPEEVDTYLRQKELIASLGNNGVVRRALRREQSIQSRLQELDTVRGVFNYFSRSQRKTQAYYEQVTELGQVIPVNYLFEDGLDGIGKRGQGIPIVALKWALGGPLLALVTVGNYLPLFVESTSLSVEKVDAEVAATYLDEKIQKNF
jgi:hypothetical protein